MTSEQQELYEILSGQYGPVLESIEMWICINALKVKPTKVECNDTFKWRFAIFDCYGIEEIAGYGDTIYEAAKAFYDSVCKTKA